MKKLKVLLSLILVLVAVLAATGYASATPSADFREKDGDVFDDWGICRTRAFGEDGFYQVSEAGFRPVITFESLGEETNLAYSLGEQFAGKYPDQSQRAEAIFHFVRDRVNYTSDIDQFEHEEFAQNADELATAIEKNGTAYGDCEDSAILLAVMFKGAGYRSAIGVSPSHTAAMVYLPDYKKGAKFELEGDSGWVWAEATGKNNPLGWVPKELVNVELAAYEISAEAITPVKVTEAPVTAVTRSGGGGSASFPFPFFSVFALLWFMSLFRRRRPR
ncbi:transglutaminase domain-containing protein [Chloroflexota bacterium]